MGGCPVGDAVRAIVSAGRSCARAAETSNQSDSEDTLLLMSLDAVQYADNLLPRS